MKWTVPNYEMGDTRVIERFLWRPLKLQKRVGDSFVWETRWMETARIVQKYDTPMYDYPHWRDEKWADILREGE